MTSARLQAERDLRLRICQTQLLAACTWTPPEMLRNSGRDGRVPVPVSFPALPPPPQALLAQMGALPGYRSKYLDLMARDWHPEDVGKPLTLEELLADQSILEARRIAAEERAEKKKRQW